MKIKLLVSLFSVACSLTLQAQVLYGTIRNMGSNGAGSINKFDVPSNSLTEVNSFDVPTGNYPSGNLFQAKDGKLYGVTVLGGSNDGGVLYSFDAVTSVYTKLFDFRDTGGTHPQASLIQGTDGKLYGITNAGGILGYGVIYSFDPVTATYIKLHDFNNTDGASPQNNLIQARNGKLYGVTYSGGNSNQGTIFSFDPTTGIFSKLHDFSNADFNGANPKGIMQASGDKLYGVAGGGDNNTGIIFSFDIPTATYKKIYDFLTVEDEYGVLPLGNLIQLPNGKLYGMTQDGGFSEKGIIFSFDLAQTQHLQMSGILTVIQGCPRGFLSCLRATENSTVPPLPAALPSMGS